MEKIPLEVEYKNIKTSKILLIEKDQKQMTLKVATQSRYTDGREGKNLLDTDQENQIQVRYDIYCLLTFEYKVFILE